MSQEGPGTDAQNSNAQRPPGEERGGGVDGTAHEAGSHEQKNMDSS